MKRDTREEMRREIEMRRYFDEKRDREREKKEREREKERKRERDRERERERERESGLASTCCAPLSVSSPFVCF